MHNRRNDKSLQNELLAIVLHDIQSPLKFIGTIMQELVMNHSNMDKELLEEHLKMANNGIASLQNYCNNINSWKKLNKQTINKKQETDINTIFTDIKYIYAPLLKFKKVIFNVVETNLHCFIEREILFIIIINLIDNAYKNTNTGNITLEAFIENNKTLIKVSDTGKGMQQKTIDDIINKNFKLTESSLGYYIIHDLLKKINGNISIKSHKNEGTSIVISLLNPEIYGSAYQDS